MATPRLRRRLEAIDENLAAKPDSALVDYLHIPEKFVSPGRRIARRLLYAFAALFYFVCCYSMSRYAAGVERRLAAGERR